MFRLNINVLPMFYQRQIKNVANYSFTTFYSYFQVVPPGIEPFASVYSNSLSDCTFLLYLL